MWLADGETPKNNEPPAPTAQAEKTENTEKTVVPASSAEVNQGAQNNASERVDQGNSSFNQQKQNAEKTLTGYISTMMQQGNLNEVERAIAIFNNNPQNRQNKLIMFLGKDDNIHIERPQPAEGQQLPKTREEAWREFTTTIKSDTNLLDQYRTLQNQVNKPTGSPIDQALFLRAHNHTVEVLVKAGIPAAYIADATPKTFAEMRDFVNGVVGVPAQVVNAVRQPATNTEVETKTEEAAKEESAVVAEKPEEISEPTKNVVVEDLIKREGPRLIEKTASMLEGILNDCSDEVRNNPSQETILSAITMLDALDLFCKEHNYTREGVDLRALLADKKEVLISRLPQGTYTKSSDSDLHRHIVNKLHDQRIKLGGTLQDEKSTESGIALADAIKSQLYVMYKYNINDGVQDNPQFQDMNALLIDKLGKTKKFVSLAKKHWYIPNFMRRMS